METMSVRRTVEMVSVLSEGVSEELGGERGTHERRKYERSNA